MRRCSDCKRELPAPVIPEDASAELKAAFEATSRVCQWCMAVNLLGGGFELPGLAERWSEEELIEMRAEASRRYLQRQQNWRIEREERRLRQQSQQKLDYEALSFA